MVKRNEAKKGDYGFCKPKVVISNIINQEEPALL